jgi:hypothetical protein
MFSFWLNLNDEDQYRLAETIEALKEARLFSKAIRDGLRIMAGLLQGDIDPLLTLYPWIIDAILVRYGQPVKPTKNSDTPSGGDGLEHKIDRLEQLILKQSVNLNPSAMMNDSLITGVVAVQLTQPPMDDDFDTLLEIKQAVNGEKSADTFRANLNALVSGSGAWAAVSTSSKRSGRGKNYESMETTA